MSYIYRDLLGWYHDIRGPWNARFGGRVAHDVSMQLCQEASLPRVQEGTYGVFIEYRISGQILRITQCLFHLEREK
jgi:hypothetical protein